MGSAGFISSTVSIINPNPPPKLQKKLSRRPKGSVLVQRRCLSSSPGEAGREPSVLGILFGFRLPHRRSGVEAPFRIRIWVCRSVMECWLGAAFEIRTLEAGGSDRRMQRQQNPKPCRILKKRRVNLALAQRLQRKSSHRLHPQNGYGTQPYPKAEVETANSRMECSLSELWLPSALVVVGRLRLRG